jgi:hypothetical protein
MDHREIDFARLSITLRKVFFIYIAEGQLAMWFGWAVSTPTRIPVLINFMPSWWYHNCGIDFGESFFHDPDYRIRSIMDMERFLFERYGRLGIGSKDPKPWLGSPDLQNATIPAMLGCEVKFQKDNYPWAHPLPPESVHSVRLPEDWTERFPVNEIMRQCRYLSEKYGQKVIPSWTIGGVQNIAYYVRGSSLFADYYLRPDLVKHLLAESFNAIKKSLEFQVQHGAWAGNVFFAHANCTVIMVSPITYERWLLPYDLALYELAKSHGLKYGIHHCGLVDRYLSLYSRVPEVFWLEVGWGSNVQVTFRTLTNTKISYIISHQFMMQSSPDQILEYVRNLLSIPNASERLSVNIPDLEYGTPEENIIAVLEAFRDPSRAST